MDFSHHAHPTIGRVSLGRPTDVAPAGHLEDSFWSNPSRWQVSGRERGQTPYEALNLSIVFLIRRVGPRSGVGRPPASVGNMFVPQSWEVGSGAGRSEKGGINAPMLGH